MPSSTSSIIGTVPTIVSVGVVGSVAKKAFSVQKPKKRKTTSKKRTTKRKQRQTKSSLMGSTKVW